MKKFFFILLTGFLKSNYLKNTSLNIIVLSKHKVNFSFYDKEVYAKVNIKPFGNDIITSNIAIGFEVIKIKKMKIFIDFSLNDFFTPKEIEKKTPLTYREKLKKSNFIFSFIFLFKKILFQLNFIWLEKDKWMLTLSFNCFIYPENNKYFEIYAGVNKSFDLNG